jgi:hypothetical protein
VNGCLIPAARRVSQHISLVVASSVHATVYFPLSAIANTDLCRDSRETLYLVLNSGCRRSPRQSLFITVIILLSPPEKPAHHNCELEAGS